MLFDLRVVLAACLATFLFAAAGLGLLAASRSPFKASAGYVSNDGPSLPAPGLPKSRGFPLPVAEKPDVTGTVADAPAPPVKTVPETKPTPQAEKRQSITTLIEEDAVRQEKAKPKPKAAAKKKPRPHVKHRAKNPPPKANSPFSLFTNNNNTSPTTR